MTFIDYESFDGLWPGAEKFTAETDYYKYKYDVAIIN